MPSKFLNISTDKTLGGNLPSDVVVSSQKAIKEYIDSHSSGSPSWGSITGTLSNQTDLQTTLNGKADTGLTNITNTAKATIAHNAMPSGTVITGIFRSPITTTAQSYTAPADGYVMVGGSGSGKAILLSVDDRTRFYQYVNGGHSFGDYTPVRKGQIVKVFISYGGGSVTLEDSYFEYAVGSV